MERRPSNSWRKQTLLITRIFVLLLGTQMQRIFIHSSQWWYSKSIYYLYRKEDCICAPSRITLVAIIGWKKVWHPIFSYWLALMFVYQWTIIIILIFCYSKTKHKSLSLSPIVVVVVFCQRTNFLIFFFFSFNSHSILTLKIHSHSTIFLFGNHNLYYIKH